MWSAVEVVGIVEARGGETDCFYNHVDAWYYAGSYRMFRMEDLTTAEWASLPIETQQSISKDTISGRKNVSPQNIYEVSQLYRCGALKAACIGLQCVGFRQDVYKSLLDQSATYTKQRVVVQTQAPKVSDQVLTSVASRSKTPDITRLVVPPPPFLRSSSASSAEGILWNTRAGNNTLSPLAKTKNILGGGEKRPTRPPADGKENMDPNITASMAALAISCGRK
ncbi:hypothetical protein BDQ17DRAFT_1367555 [Cyathus striatus]|nr:hypothetical protein BDQ17DRAFT_1367555 [Cyathus striatus]